MEFHQKNRKNSISLTVNMNDTKLHNEGKKIA
jgi:hypothetical protein